MSVHVNIGGAYKKVDSVWCNIGGVWKKASNIMTNINGVWKDGGLEKLLSYYGTVTPLGEARTTLGGGNNGLYAVFAGGTRASDGAESSYVDSYSASLVRTSPGTLWRGRKLITGGDGEQHVFFAGGVYDNSGITTVEVADRNLTISSVTGLSNAKTNFASANVSGYTLFAGGKRFAYQTYYTSVDAYNTNLVKTVCTDLSLGVSNLGGTSLNGYALFGGGAYTSSLYTANVRAYNSSLVQTSLSSLQVATESRGASNGDYAIFSGSTYTAYNSSLVRVTCPGPSVTGTGSSLSMQGHALFLNSNTLSSRVVESYNTSLVRSSYGVGVIPRDSVAVASIGVYGLFAGGQTSAGTSTAVDTVNAFALA